MIWDTVVNIGWLIFGSMVAYFLLGILCGLSNYVSGWGLDRRNRARRNAIRHQRWVRRMKRASLDVTVDDTDMMEGRP